MAPLLATADPQDEPERRQTVHSPQPFTLVMQEPIGRALRIAAQVLIPVAVAACGGGDGAVSPPVCTVSAVTISPTPATVAAGSSTTVTANVTSAHCGSLSTTWQSGATSIATVDNAGVVHGILPGTATISATVSGQSGSTVVTVGPGPILSLSSVAPAANALNVGIDGSIKMTFSEPINAATATASNIRLATGAATITGTIVVAGNVVTLNPAAPLTEFNSVYTVTITPSVLSTAGDYLAANQTSTFTTAFLDPTYYYRITNELQGPAKALDTYSSIPHGCFMGDLGQFTGQFWFAGPIAGQDGYYTLRNLFQLDAEQLDAAGSATPNVCGLVAPPTTGPVPSAQAWKIAPFGAAYPKGYRLQDLVSGANQSLDAPAVNVGNTSLPMMQPTSASTSQVWYFTRITHR
jgi:hypothetical protein